MDERQELGRDQPAVLLRGLLVRLRMIEVNLRDARRRDVLFEQFVAPDRRQPHIRQAPLVGSPRGIAQHQRQDIDPQMIALAVGRRRS